MSPIPEDRLREAFRCFLHAQPFPHTLIDQVLPDSLARSVEAEFPSDDACEWVSYDNPLEHKKTLNRWECFGPSTRELLLRLCSDGFVETLSRCVGRKLIADPGLHGGGLHLHGDGGNLNPHLDYSLHPKLKLERVLNLILYLSDPLDATDQGHLGLWEHHPERNGCGALVQTIAPRFNRAVFFDPTGQAWHGLSQPLQLPPGVYRKSLAIFYHSLPGPTACNRPRALFSLRPEQRDNPELRQLILERSR